MGRKTRSTFKKAALTAFMAGGFASLATASEPPLRYTPAEPTAFSDHAEPNDSKEDRQRAAVLITFLALGGAGAYFVTRKRSMFGDAKGSSPDKKQ